jgi:TPR repeat protein
MKMAQVAALLFLAGSITDLLAGTPKELAAEAAAKGDLDAMFELGSIALSKGEYAGARAWLKKASDKNHAPSMAALGFLYFKGFGVAEDTAKARGLYEQSAKAGAHRGFEQFGPLIPVWSCGVAEGCCQGHCAFGAGGPEGKRVCGGDALDDVSRG